MHRRNFNLPDSKKYTDITKREESENLMFKNQLIEMYTQIFGGWGDRVARTSPHCLVGTHRLHIDSQISTSTFSFDYASVALHLVSVAVAAGASQFGRVSICHAFGGSAGTSHANPSAFFVYHAFCGVPTIAFCGRCLGAAGLLQWE